MGEEMPNQEKEREDILSTLERACESQSKVELTVQSLDGKSLDKGVITPWSFEGDILWGTTENGEGMPIELSRIKEAKAIE